VSVPALFLTRARLRRDAPAAAIRELLVPRGESDRVAAGHRVVWTLFGDAPDRTRDFLWREAEPGLYYFLSERAPEDRHGLFEIETPKPFAPVLATGDRLSFSLRANATVARGGGPGKRGKPCDVVMDALYRVPKGERAEARTEAVDAAGRAWLEKQGAKSGFAIPLRPRAAEAEGEDDGEGSPGCAVSVMGYRTLRLGRAGAPARLGILDIEGVLEVCDPAAFVASIARGFGRAKAFGCGLMLIRRAS